MAFVKITDLIAATTPLIGTELFEIVQGGVSKRAAVNSIGFIPAGANAVLRTAQTKMLETISVADYTSLTAAITAAKVSGRPTVILINGDITVTSTIVVDAPNIMLQGAGGDTSHDVGTQGAGARAKLIWAGSAGGTVLQFASPVGAGNQKCGGGGATGLFINCNNIAAIGLQVLSWAKGTFENLHFNNPTTVGLDVGVVATLGEARDTQNCYFRNLSSRHFEVAGGTGGLIRLDGDATANTSLNMFEQLDCGFVNGTAYLFNNSDNNYFVRVRAFRAGGGTGNAVVFNGSDAGVGQTARSNTVNYLTTNGALPIICRGTTTFTYPSRDNNLLLDFDNGYAVPTIETGASAPFSDTRGLQANFGYVGVSAGNDITNTLAAEARLGTSTLHVVNGSENHMRLTDAAGANDWGMSIDGSGNLRVVRFAGAGSFNLPSTTTLPYLSLAGRAYISANSTTDQTGSVSAATAVKLENTDFGAGITIANDGGGNPTRITFAVAGTYMIAPSIQFANSTASDHDATVWFRLNGTNIANSATIVNVPKVADGGAQFFQVVIYEQVTAGQYIEIMWLPENAGVTVDFTAAGAIAPAIPSVILTAERIA